MTSAIVVVVAIIVGLPVLAWWVGNRRVWSRLRPGADPDPWGDVMRRFDLTPQETARVESAVTWGRRLDDERLRRAAVHWGRQIVQQTGRRRRIRSSWGRAVVIFGAVTVVAGGMYRLSEPRGTIACDAVVWLLLWPAALGWWARGPRRAVRLNADAPDDSTTH